MFRLSREMRVRRWLLILGLLIWTALAAACGYAALLNHRLTRELISHRWREPTLIVSAAHSPEVRVAILYGIDWRVTQPVTLDALPPYVPNAFIAAEDVRFRQHMGVDPIGILRAGLKDLMARHIVEGGSTIDQQIIKPRFLSQARTWRRKIPEVLLALLLDAQLPKDEILEIYLNEVYLGHSAGKPVLGIDEAAQLYFAKDASQLRLDEAAELAGMIRAPNRDTPQKRPDVIRARRDFILGVMRSRSWITDAQYSEATAHGVTFANGAIPVAPYPFYLRALRAEIVAAVGLRTVLEGGLTIVSEMDPAAQRAAEHVARLAPRQLQSRYDWIAAEARTEPLEVAIFSVDPRSGGIRALVGGRDYRLSSFDRAQNMRRQPGSAFKTFAYLPAIASKRATPATLLLDAPLSVDVSDHETWAPHNYDEQYRGRVTVREAFEKSLNVPTIRLSEDIGVRRVANTAEKFGFDEKFPDIPALPLGVTEVTLRELTAAYTAFPNLGIRVEPYLVREIRDDRGKSLFLHAIEKERVADAAPSYVMHSLLRGVVQRGTAARLKRYGLGYVAGKTGTTNDYRDAWFVGYTPDVVSTVWVGFDHGAPLRLSSAEAAIPIWGAYMTAFPHDRGELKPPGGVTFRDIDPETGLLWREGCPGPLREVFLSGTAPTHACPAGFFGAIARKLFFDRQHFDEPAAITLDQFRRWAGEVDRERQNVQGVLDRLRRIFR
jgi:penicillin-binding protein 1B